MKINLLRFKTIIKKNAEFTFLLSTALIVILLIQTFNFIKEKQKKHFFRILNNIYFEKTLHNILENLDPRYVNIKHKISSGETFNSILNNYEIPLKEINKVNKILSKKKI